MDDQRSIAMELWTKGRSRRKFPTPTGVGTLLEVWRVGRSRGGEGVNPAHGQIQPKIATAPAVEDGAMVLLM